MAIDTTSSGYLSIQKKFSKSQIAKIFRVNRSTIYAWENQGCPTVPPERPGYSARMDFEAVLNWRLDMLEDLGWTKEGLALEERLARALKAQFDV